MTKEVELDPTKCAEYLRDEVLAVMRQEQSKPWKTMNESEQEWAAARVEQIAKTVVGRICNVIAKAGQMSIGAKMGKLSTDKNNNLETKVTFLGDLEDEEKLAILDHVNANVVVVLMDASDFIAIEKTVKIDKDQPALPGTEPAEQQEEAFAGETTAPTEMPVAQQPGQPSWPEVAAALAEDADAGVVIEDETAPPVKNDDLIEDGDEMTAEELNTIVNIPNPTAKATAATTKKK